MTHRVTKLEFRILSDRQVVAAYGKSARGTKFLIKELGFSTTGLSKDAIALKREQAIVALMGQHDSNGL